MEPGAFWLVTLHRSDLTDRPEVLREVVRRLNVLEVAVVFPMHPRTRRAMDEAGLWGDVPARVRVLPPIGYLETVGVLAQARGVVTDSGGVQREAYLLGTPCFVVRDETLWPELLGWNRLVGHGAAGLEAALAEERPTRERPDLLGDGRTAERIAEVLEECSLNPFG